MRTGNRRRREAKQGGPSTRQNFSIGQAAALLLGWLALHHISYTFYVG